MNGRLRQVLITLTILDDEQSILGFRLYCMHWIVTRWWFFSCYGILSKNETISLHLVVHTTNKKNVHSFKYSKSKPNHVISIVPKLIGGNRYMRLHVFVVFGMISETRPYHYVIPRFEFHVLKMEDSINHGSCTLTLVLTSLI